MTNVTIVGLDLAKSVFQVHAVDNEGYPVVRGKLRRGQVLVFFAGLSPCPALSSIAPYSLNS